MRLHQLICTLMFFGTIVQQSNSWIFHLQQSLRRNLTQHRKLQILLNIQLQIGANIQQDRTAF